MHTELTTLQPAAAAALAEWHRMVAARDLAQLANIVHPDAVFRSPMAFNEYRTAPALVMAINTVMQVFEDFSYQRQFASADGLNVTLEFSARVADKQLKGVDLIQFDPAGRIVAFEVMIRPFSGLKALGEEMGKRIGHLLPNFKGQ